MSSFARLLPSAEAAGFDPRGKSGWMGGMGGLWFLVEYFGNLEAGAVECYGIFFNSSNNTAELAFTPAAMAGNSTWNFG